MIRKTGMLISLGAACLGGSVLVLQGCQQENANPAEAAGDRQYALEVQKLKAGPEGAFDAGLTALETKLGMRPVAAEPGAPAGEAAPLEKAAATQVFSATGNCSRISKFIFRMDPGDRVVFRANSKTMTDGSKSDPVVMLIQFNDAGFIANGEVPEVTQAGFKILARNDDVESGNLTAAIDYTFKEGESGNFMVMAFPYSNASSTRFVGLILNLYQANCPNCDYIIKNPFPTLGGLIYKIKGADDFRANRVSDAGDPRLYVVTYSLRSGMSNGNSNYLTKNSKVYPYPVSVADGFKEGNMILIDNESAGTASFTHTQFSP